MRKPALVLCVVAALLQAPALAAPVTVDEAMRDVSALYVKGDLPAALAAIEEARPLARTRDDEATLAGWSSLLFYASRRYDDAKLAMRACLELALDAPPPDKGPPGYAHDFELMRRAVRKLREAHPETVGQSPAAAELKRATRPVKPVRRVAAIGGVIGGAAVLAGAILVVHARRDHARIEDATVEAPLALADARQLATAGSVEQVAGVICLSVGGAAVVTALVLLGLNPEDAPVTPQLGLAPGVFGVGLAGRLP